ncbi:MAG: glycerophosphodiester phosphodiesterase family protein [Clostridia bacterium]|jgi:glycerophosphoryl diester phosphodiesterase|nr:glycerophosphodiester phosphodiesterase family protein [Clostridiaceae bacterium]HJJ14651.1 glycerophosphodiester phosphodiesterase family protein [Clostridiaceae bacterium]
MKDLKFLKETIIAHRGVHNEKDIIENSLEAFKEAVNKNYIIELDVHFLKDGEVVVFHDDNIERMTGINKNLKDCTYDEIRNIKLLNKNTYIPKFSDVLKLVDGKVPILIELKNDNKVGLLESSLVQILKKYNGKYAVQSFNPLSIMWFKNNYPNIIRGQLVCKFKNKKMDNIKKFILKTMFFNIITNPDFISHSVDDLSYKEVNKIKKNKFILGWTVRNKERYDELIKYYDNLICEKFI